MSHLGYPQSRNEYHVEFRTSHPPSEQASHNIKYVHTQHLSTPPAHYRTGKNQAENSESHVSQNYEMNNTIKYQPSEGRFMAGQKFVKLINQLQPVNMQNPRPVHSSQYDQRMRTPPTASFYQGQRGLQQTIPMIYEQKKQQYITRIKRLPDHVEIKYPDGGRYLGQVLSQQGKKKVGAVIQSVKDGQGIFFYPNGDIYFGSWKQQLFNGQGVYLFSTGQIYDGLLKNSAKQGRGTYYYQQANAFYSGTWSNDIKHGTGVLNTPQQYYQGQWNNGTKHGNGYYKNKIVKFVYVGEFLDGIKDGKGRMVYPDGSVYAGEFHKEMPHGVGDFQYPNKDKYIGQFYEGKKHGKGNYFFAEGTIFTGKWKDDQKIQGQLTLFNGDVFTGTFSNNQRHHGQYRYKNGDLYEGAWKNDVKQGFGKLYLQNGQKYQGRFSQGQKHGEGVYTWKNGDRYEGSFVYDKRQGLGEYYWSDGGFYKGQWKADRMNGFGRLVKDGVDVVGEFFSDHFERPIDEAELGSLRNFVMG